MRKVKLGDLWEESKIVSESPDSDKRIRVKLNVNGVEKRPDKNDKTGATKYFKRKARQFIYGKQNLHKGAFGIIPKELDEHESSSDIPAFDIIEECNPEWIYYYFKQGDFYKGLEQYSKGTGSKRIHPDKIAHLEIPLPERKEQDKIIEKIKLQENIHSELSNEINEQKTLLTKLKQAILSEAVQGKLVSQNPSDESAVELLKKIKKEKEKLIKEGKIKKGKELPVISDDEIPYKLPSGWVWCRLGEVCFQITDGTHHTPTYVAKGIPFLSVKNLSHGKIDFSNTKYISQKEHQELIKRCNPEYLDLLLTKVGTTGIARVINIKKDFSIFVSVALLKYPQKLIYPYYLEYLINSPFVKKMSSEGTEGVGNKNLVLRKIVNFIIPLPPLAEQRRIVEKVDELMKFCDELELRIKENKEGSKRLMGAVLGEAFLRDELPFT